jgi:hypothetical protein
MTKLATKLPFAGSGLGVDDVDGVGDVDKALDKAAFRH